MNSEPQNKPQRRNQKLASNQRESTSLSSKPVSKSISEKDGNPFEAESCVESDFWNELRKPEAFLFRKDALAQHLKKHEELKAKVSKLILRSDSRSESDNVSIISSSPRHKSSVFHKTGSLDRKERGTLPSGSGHLENQACLGKPSPGSPDSNFNSCGTPWSSNLILACKGVHMELHKGTGHSDLCPSLKAEFGDNKFQGFTLDAFHTEPGTAPVSRCYGCLEGAAHGGCLDGAACGGRLDGAAQGGSLEEGDKEGLYERNFRERRSIHYQGEDDLDKELNLLDQTNRITLFVKNPEGKTRTFQMERNEQIVNVKRRIQKIEDILIHDQILTFAGRVMINSNSIDDYDCLSGSTLHLSGRIRGGSDQGETQQNTHKYFKDVHALLSPVIGFFKGDDIPSQSIMDESDNLIQASGDFLYQILNRLLGDRVHIIHPNSFSLYSLFEGNEENREKAIDIFISQIFDRKCIHLKDKREAFINNPKFDKPVVAILNTMGSRVKEHDTNPLEEYHGSHWVAFVFTPRGFKGLCSSEEQKESKDIFSKERIYLFDSLPSFPRRELPSGLKQALINGKVVYDSIENTLKETTIMPAVSKNTEFWNFTKDRQQTPRDNSCGFWSLFNLLMVLLQGNDTFMWKLFHLDSSEEETKFNAGCYLRWIFNKLMTQSPHETIETLSKYLDLQEAGVRSDNYPAGDVSHDIQEIALTLAQAEAETSEEEKTNMEYSSYKDTPTSPHVTDGSKRKAPRGKRSSKKKEKEGSVKRRNKRKLDDFYQRNIKNMLRGSPPTNTKKRMKTKGLDQDPQEKIMLNISELGQEYNKLKLANKDLQEKLQELENETKVKEDEIEQLKESNAELKRQCEQISKAKEGHVWAIVELTKNEKQILEKELEIKNRQLQRMNDLQQTLKNNEGIVQTQGAQIQMILEENSHLKKRLEFQRREAEITLSKVMNGLEAIKTNSQSQVTDPNISFGMVKGDKYPSSRQTQVEHPERMEIEDKSPVVAIQKKKVVFNSQSHIAMKGNEPAQRQNHFKDGKRSPRKDISIFIPWKGKVLTPSPSQILTYEGDLNRIYQEIGYREPNEKERQFHEIRIFWKGITLKPTPRQLLVSKGNLNELAKFLKAQQPAPFRQKQSEGRRRYSSSSPQFAQ